MKHFPKQQCVDELRRQTQKNQTETFLTISHFSFIFNLVQLPICAAFSIYIIYISGVEILK